MNPSNLNKSYTEEQELEIVREVKAPKELVFKLFTELEHLTKWWGPAGFDMINCTLDLKPGGEFRYCMRSAEGYEMWGKFIFCEIVAPDTLSYISSFCDADGNILRHPLSATWPLETFSSISFTEKDGITKITLTGGPVNANAEEVETFASNRQNVQKGFDGTWLRLEEYLAVINK